MYDLKIDIGLIQQNIFKQHGPLKPYRPVAKVLEIEASKGLVYPERIIFGYELCSLADLDMAYSSNAFIPYEILKQKLFMSEMSFYEGMMFIYSLTEKTAIDQYKNIPRFESSIGITFEIYLMRYAAQKNLKVILINDNLELQTLWEGKKTVEWIRNLRDIDHTSSKFKPGQYFTNFSCVKESNYFIYTDIQRIEQNQDHYRLYLDDKLLVERVMMSDVNLLKKTWQEHVILKNVGPDSVLTLQSPLNLCIEKLQINAKVSFPCSTSTKLKA